MSEELTLLPCPACGASDVVMRVDTRAYGFCHACGMCGPCAPKVDAEYAIRPWNSIPRALTWTTEPPQVPGWYWCRHKSYPEYAVVRKVWPEVWAEFGVPDGYDQWAGPIPEPREPKEQGGHDG